MDARRVRELIMFGNICVLLILLVMMHKAFSVLIEQCNDGRTIIVEGRTSSITCNGISKNRNVRWWYRLPNAIFATHFGTCITDNMCMNILGTYFNVSRGGERSSLFLLLNKRTYAGMTVGCEQENRITPNEYHECVISVKSQVELRNCHVKLSVSSWSLYGSCFLYNMYSSINQYDCSWVLDGAILNQFVASSLQQYIDKNTSLWYYQVTCLFTSRLPSKDGKYKYYIASKPEVAHPYSYELIIRRPGKLNVSSCPVFVPENASVTCKCEANPPGSPPALVTWEGHNDSTTLSLLHVHRADNGRQFSCHFSWATYQTSEEFELRVAYGPDGAEILESTFTDVTGDTLTNLTCNASSYFPDVLYTWSIPCNIEVLVDKTSVCSTTFQDQRTEVTCTAVNTQFPTLKAVAVMTVYQEGSSQQSKDTLFFLALIGGLLGILTILSVSAGLAVYIKRRKGSKVTSRFTDYTNETYITSAEVSSVVLKNLPEDKGNKQTEDFGTQHAEDVGIDRKRERGDTSSDIYAVPDKSAKLKQKRDSRQSRESRPSAMTEKPKKMSVLGDNGKVNQIFDDSGKFDHSGSEGLYENVATQKTERTADSVDSRKCTSSRNFQEENLAQLHNDEVLYNRLSFSSKTRSVTITTPSESVYNRLDHQ